MVKKITAGLFVCMFVFVFGFVSIAVSEEYSGTVKLKGKWMGLDEDKEKIKEKCTICMEIDEDGDVDGVMVCDEGGEDETEFELEGCAGDQAFSIWAYVEEDDEWTQLGIVGKVKEKKNGELMVKGIFTGEEEEYIGEYSWETTGVSHGKIKAKLAPGECMPDPS